MAIRPIDGNELLGIERLLNTNVVRQSKTASWLLDQVLHDIQAMPTLTPPNEWVNRVRELDELYTKLQIVTGFTAEQLLENFAAGYTLKKPYYSKKFAEMENLAEAAQPNEPLTLEQLREMDGEPVWVVVSQNWRESGIEGGWRLVKFHINDDRIRLYMFDTHFGASFFAEQDMGRSYWVSRRPPERQEDEHGE